MKPALALLLALATQAQTPPRPPAAPALLAPRPPARPVTLGELRANPGAFLGEEVAFALQFRSAVESWDPYLSRFDPGRWLALEVWPDEGFAWDEEVFAHPFARLFLRRGGGFEPLARRAHAYQRFEARARVREAFLGEPWLELIELVPLEGEVGEGTVLHVTRARDLAAEGKLDLALDQYERARAAPLPPHALAAVLAEMQEVEQARAQAKRERREPPAADEGAAPADGEGEAFAPPER